MTLNTEVLSTLSAKSWAFSGLVLAVLLPSLSIRYLRGPLGLRKFVISRHDFFGFHSKLMKLQNSSQLIVDSWFILVLVSFCNLFMVDLVLGSCVLFYSRLSLHFSFIRSKMA